MHTYLEIKSFALAYHRRLSINDQEKEQLIQNWFLSYSSFEWFLLNIRPYPFQCLVSNLWLYKTVTNKPKEKRYKYKEIFWSMINITQIYKEIFWSMINITQMSYKSIFLDLQIKWLFKGQDSQKELPYCITANHY